MTTLSSQLQALKSRIAALDPSKLTNAQSQQALRIVSDLTAWTPKAASADDLYSQWQTASAEVAAVATAIGLELTALESVKSAA